METASDACAFKFPHLALSPYESGYLCWGTFNDTCWVHAHHNSSRYLNLARFHLRLILTAYRPELASPLRKSLLPG